MFFLQRVVNWVDRMRWLDPAARTLQRGVKRAYSALGPAGKPLQNFWNGVGLGHPLHTVLNDITIGSWTAATALDALDMITGREELGDGADAAIAVGLASTAVTVLSGLTDWQHLSGHQQRVGLGHALINTAIALTYGASLFLRRRGLRTAGWGAGLLAYGGLSVSAYFGSHLVYEDLVGVNHSNEGALPNDYADVLGENELAEGQSRKVNVGDWSVVLIRQGGDIYALSEKCAHLGGPLSQGSVEGNTVTCPWHGSQYDIQDGRVLAGPSAHNQPCLDVRVRNGRVEVRRHRPEPPGEREEVAERKWARPEPVQPEPVYYRNVRPEEGTV